MSSIEPVRKEVVVNVSAERAFRVFTEGVDGWWPRKHHIGTSPLKRTIIEPGVGGRWYSVCEDGTECDVGRVVLWEPPTKLLLSWQITAAWQYDPSFRTDVVVDFVALGPKSTRVTLEHRDLHRYGVAAEEIRGMVNQPGGWLLCLEEFARVAETEVS
ncbi:MAG TPA: SRPBCC family protein [Polyangiaceae bacterium]|nr:SRPBCC family protein [Polyangiaceae bacterium]